MTPAQRHARVKAANDSPIPIVEELDETQLALKRVQDFEVSSLVRENDLGNKFAFKEIVDPARKVIDLFRMIAPSHLDFFPERQKKIIKDEANSFYHLLDQCLNFDIESAQPSPMDAKINLVNQVTSKYQSAFDQIFLLISFATARSQDFSRLERDARAASQSARDQAERLMTDLSEQKSAADSILTEVRAVAAEQGVSKQAIHFKNEADSHKELSDTWFKRTVWLSIGLAIYAVISLFFHRVPGLDNLDGYRGGQLIISKVLIFAVIAYMLFLSARNFMSHKHKEVVNRHRQNALATFTALAEATSDAASSDIVLSHAAACIFSPQDTRYAKGEGGHSEGVPNLQLIPRIGNVGSA